jgi:hypothetical protein
MGNIDISELRKSIDKLDSLLSTGHIKYQEMFGSYDIVSKETDFNLEGYFDSESIQYEIWADQCVKIIDKLPRKHYLFHFKQFRIGAKFTGAIPPLLSKKRTIFEYQLYALEDIILGLEENESMALRKEIADKEYHADVIYKVRYVEHSREVRVNNIVLHTPNYESENDKFISYVIGNPGRPIPKEELEDVCGTFTKRLDHIVRDLGFTGNLAKIFFPVKTKSEILFINPITNQYKYKNNLPTLNIFELGRASKVQ